MLPEINATGVQRMKSFVIDPFKPSIVDYAALVFTSFVILLTFPISLFFCIKIVKEYDRLVIFRLGRLWHSKAMGPGVVFVFPFIDTHKTVDLRFELMKRFDDEFLRTMSYDVPTQEMLTKDSVTVAVDAAVYYRTSNPIASLSSVCDAHSSTRQLAQSTLRNVLGTRTLAEIMFDRSGIAAQAKFILDNATLVWGIRVERVEIKDIRIPRELCRTMAAEAEAQRASDAKVVTAAGELNASFALKKAADELVDSPYAIQLRYLQSLSKISGNNNHTIVVPVPTELIMKWKRKSNK